MFPFGIAGSCFGITGSRDTKIVFVLFLRKVTVGVSGGVMMLHSYRVPR